MSNETIDLRNAIELTPRGGRRLTDAAYNAVWLTRVTEMTARGADGCWTWLGNKAHNGYGQVQYRGRAHIVHRKVYEVVYGIKIDRWIYVCHRCDVKLCINPEHLWLGTPKENIHDSVRKRRHAELRKTHCDRGHEFTPENTILRKTAIGTPCRVCRACERIRSRLSLGWTLEEATSLPVTPPGYRRGERRRA